MCCDSRLWRGSPSNRLSSCSGAGSRVPVHLMAPASPGWSAFSPQLRLRFKVTLRFLPCGVFVVRLHSESSVPGSTPTRMMLAASSGSQHVLPLLVGSFLLGFSPQIGSGDAQSKQGTGTQGSLGRDPCAPKTGVSALLDQNRRQACGCSVFL